jgi:hypothetical protein
MLFFYHINVAAGIMLLRRDAYVTISAPARLSIHYIPIRHISA